MSNAGADSRKRRAARACLACRKRKIRCDVARSGMPCTNCRLDSVECVVTKSRRGGYVARTKVHIMSRSPF
ncbi:hypothetical protein BDV33DRAFT_186257 [Aspergillus novoparasiticus]|uniref:Zn(2)-C6 fungal-type domain-containing protein n=1 Tax=Aspergillus novoparasiticus TaxID=986946 RepID=A0A5N6E7A8_9EURO|nr:hypothetical protein BDV33DRAFT_186257 [Aspergillus novoparasiticus]